VIINIKRDHQYRRARFYFFLFIYTPKAQLSVMSKVDSNIQQQKKKRKTKTIDDGQVWPEGWMSD
jgi:hypothetical protein